VTVCPVRLVVDDTEQVAYHIVGGEVRAGRGVVCWQGSIRQPVSRFPRLSYDRMVTVPSSRAAQAATRGVGDRKPGYQVRNVASHSPFKTRVRICSRRCAPRLVHCICCFFTMRLLTTWFTVDSTKPVLMRSPWW
jgi:hypothetical protein